jgi:hypothetical protein
MTSDRFGLAVHQHPNAWPSKAEQIRLGVRVLRVLVIDQGLFKPLIEEELAEGVKVIALINSQTIGMNLGEGRHGLEGRIKVITDFAHTFGGKVFAVECLNEWDVGGDKPGGFKNTLEEVVGFALDASPILRNAGIKCLLGSVVGDLRQRLTDAVGLVESLSARDQLDGVCIHPYLRPALGVPAPEPKTGAWLPPEVHEVIQDAFDLVNGPDEDGNPREPVLPVYATEFGLPMNPSDPGDLQAEFVANCEVVLGQLPDEVLGAACYFSYSDDSGGGPDEVFGLVRHDLSPRGGLFAFMNAANPSIGPAVAGPPLLPPADADNEAPDRSDQPTVAVVEEA